MDDADRPDDEGTRELDRLRKVLQGLRGDHSRLRHEMLMLRQDMAAIYGLCRLLADRTQPPPRPDLEP